MISEQLRVTLLSLKQISDRLKLLNTTSVTKSEALAYKNEIIEALDDIDFTEITEALDSIDGKIGTAPVGSDKATIFAWLTTIYEYLAGQTPEEIPEGLGDRINLLLQFFGLPESLPEYTLMTETEVKAISDSNWESLYGYGEKKNILHWSIPDGQGSTTAMTTSIWFKVATDSSKRLTYAQQGWSNLYADVLKTTPIASQYPDDYAADRDIYL